MKDKIFKLMLIVSLCLGTYGCSLFRKAHKTDTDTGAGVPAMYGQTVMYSAWQLDSMCTADGITADLGKWVMMTFYDHETQAQINRYAFIKTLGENEEITYILTPVDTLYQITKRIVREEAE